ncbi:MAG TPA: hypothetical protein VGL88_03600 [Pseudonocardiaceae bacterium]
MDRAGLSAREIADYLGHERISMTQDVYMSRQSTGGRGGGGRAGPTWAERKRGVNVGLIFGHVDRKSFTCGEAPPAGFEPAA